MITKAKLTELIRRRLTDGYPSINDSVKDPEIQMVIGLAANKLLKTESLNKFAVDGETLVDGAVVQTYERLPIVIDETSYTKVLLPTTPIFLPNNMGVFAVYPSGRLEDEFIPIPIGVYSIMKKEKMLSSINRFFYSYDNKHITIYADLRDTGVNEVDVRLCTMDIDQIGAHDLLPLDSGMETDIITYAISFFTNKQVAD